MHRWNSKIDGLFRRANLFYASKTFVWIIIGFGIVLRVAQYLFNRSLWLDEAMLAINIISRPLPELLQPLSYDQAAPIGFLMAEKLAVDVFGTSEYALRLFPILCGTLSIFLFYAVARHDLEIQAVPIALGLFAISDKLIYFSSEVKQYSSDVAIALSLYAVAIYFKSERLSHSRIALCGAIGAAAIWFSHPAIFILAGLGLTSSAFCFGQRNWSGMRRLSIVYSIWLSSFAASYFISLRPLIHNEHLLEAWRGSFIPIPPWTFSDAKVLISSFFKIFDNPVGLSVPFIAALTFLMGCISMFLRKKSKLLVLISPLPFVLLASSLHMYPFSGRFVLFTVPFVLLFIAEGSTYIAMRSSRISAIMAVIVIGLLASPPLLDACYHLITPRTREEIKPVIRYLRQHRQDKDLLFVARQSRAAFEYYSESYGFNKSDSIEYLEELRGGTRVWVLFSHYSEDLGKGKQILHFLQMVGTRLDAFEAPGAVVHLYALAK